MKARNFTRLLVTTRNSTTGAFLRIFLDLQNTYFVKYVWIAVSAFCKVYGLHDSTWMIRKFSFIFLFPRSFPLAKEKKKFLASFLVFLSSYLCIFKPDLVGYFVKIIGNNRRSALVSTHATKKIPGKENGLKIFGE